MDLGEFLNSRRVKAGLSLRQVAEKAAAQGVAVSSSTLHAVESGQRVDVSDRVLAGIAAGLGCPEAEVRRAAGRPASRRPFVLPERAELLTARERRLILGMVDALLDARDDR